MNPDKECYPCMYTQVTFKRLKYGCESGTVDDCCFLCIPFALVADIITFVPFFAYEKLNKCSS